MHPWEATLTLLQFLQLKRNKFLKNLKANLTIPKGHNIVGIQRVNKKERDNSVSHSPAIKKEPSHIDLCFVSTIFAPFTVEFQNTFKDLKPRNPIFLISLKTLPA